MSYAASEVYKYLTKSSDDLLISLWENMRIRSPINKLFALDAIDKANVIERYETVMLR